MKEDSNQKLIIVAALSFIVGFGLAWLILANKETNTTSDPADKTTEEIKLTDSSDPMNSDRSNMIVVNNQKEGTLVTLDKVVLTKTSWIVIHEIENSQPTKILGAQLYDAGTWSGSVELLRGTIAGGKYMAMIHEDNGDRAFDPKRDTPALDKDGKTIAAEFETRTSEE
jgi:hypothetical protein